MTKSHLSNSNAPSEHQASSHHEGYTKINNQYNTMQRDRSKQSLRNKKTSPIPMVRDYQQQRNQVRANGLPNRLQGKKEFQESVRNTRNDKNSFCTVM